MEDNKYYTPTYEEFHEGFEYQIRKFFVRGASIEKSGEFVDKKFEWHDYRIVKDAIDSKYENWNFIRVPFLSKEDIEAEGFNIHKITKEFQICATKGAIVRGEEASCNIIYNLASNWLLITFYLHIWPEEKTVFAGIIKNKSEFKKVLKMIGV